MKNPAARKATQKRPTAGYSKEGLGTGNLNFLSKISQPEELSDFLHRRKSLSFLSGRGKKKKKQSYVPGSKLLILGRCFVSMSLRLGLHLPRMEMRFFITVKKHLTKKNAIKQLSPFSGTVVTLNSSRPIL